MDKKIDNTINSAVAIAGGFGVYEAGLELAYPAVGKFIRKTVRKPLTQDEVIVYQMLASDLFVKEGFLDSGVKLKNLSGETILKRYYKELDKYYDREYCKKIKKLIIN